MAGIVDPSPRSFLGRFLPGPVRSVARNLWGTFRFAPWPVKIMLALVFVAGPAAILYHLGVRKLRNANTQQQVQEWRGFEEGAKRLDDDQMLVALDRVLAVNPGDAIALGRKRAIETGEADPADQTMVILSLRRHLRANRLADAEREARKRLAAEKADWLSRCVVAAAHLQRGDRDGAAAELDQLPAPGHQSARLDPGGLLYAYRLFRGVGKDPAPLRQFTQGVILPLLKSTQTARMSAAEKTALVECYAETFDPAAARQPAVLVEAWAVAAKLLDAAADEAAEARDVGTLARVGRVGGTLEAGLAALRRADQVTEAEHPALLGDLRERSRRAWEGVLANDPASPDGHRGLATVLLRTLDTAPAEDKARVYTQARDVLVKGLKAKADDPELARLFARLLTAEGRPLEAAQLLLAQARQHPDQTVWWGLTVEAALAANRRDVALEACAQLRAKDPDNRWAAATEARLRVEGGQPTNALALLARLGDDALVRDPLSAYSYARALAETGAADRLTGFLSRLAGADQPVVAGAAARGLTDAVGLTPADVQARLAGLLERYPEQPELLRARAVATYRAAEHGEPLWEVQRLTAAVRATEQALSHLPDDLDLVTQLGWLRLAERNLPAAARAVAPLKAAGDRLSARQHELLGAVALAADDLPTATRHLEKATRSADPPAGAFALLARVYHAAGQRGQARATLEGARGRSRSPREQAEYLVTARLVAP